MYKLDLALNNLQWLIYHKTKLNQTNQVILIKFIHTVISLFRVAGTRKLIALICSVS